MNRLKAQTVLVLGLGSLLFAREVYGLLMRPVLLAHPARPCARNCKRAPSPNHPPIHNYEKHGLQGGCLGLTP